MAYAVPSMSHRGEVQAADALGRMIARLVTQRDCIDFAAALITGLPGCVLELGLGKGRTFDHIRRIFPARDIHVFDCEIHCAPHLVPDPPFLHLGDFRDTLPEMAASLGRGAALAHADIGTEDQDADMVLAGNVAPMVAALVRRGGLVLSDRALPLEAPSWRRMPLPRGAVSAGWPYFIWQALR